MLSAVAVLFFVTTFFSCQTLIPVQKLYENHILFILDVKCQETAIIVQFWTTDRNYNPKSKKNRTLFFLEIVGLNVN